MNFKPFLPFALLVSGIVALCGCAGSGSTAPGGPGVRVINGLSTVPEADVTVGTIVVANPLPYATISGNPAHPYSIIPTGPQPLILANVNTTTISVASASVNVLTTQDIDAIAYNAASPQFLVLFDSLSIPTNQDVRLVNASTAIGSVDFFLNPFPTTGSTNGPFTLSPGSAYPAQAGTSGAYLGLSTSGAYILTIYPAGKDSGTPLVQETVNLPATVSWTFVLLDPPAGQTAPIVLQVQDNLLHDTAP